MFDLDLPPNWPPSYAEINEARGICKELTIACVYWGNKYPPFYVRRLWNAVQRHLPVPHRFVCVTADSVIADMGIECVRPPTGHDGWWQKVGLFAPELFGSEAFPILYLDIDIVIKGSLLPLVRHNVPHHGLVMIENFGPNRWQAAHNSSAMLWINGTCNEIYFDFIPEYTKRLHGDQCWIWRRMYKQIDNFKKGLIVSYKYDCQKGPPDGSSVVVFHGKPDPHEVKSDWVEENWK